VKNDWFNFVKNTTKRTDVFNHKNIFKIKITKIYLCYFYKRNLYYFISIGSISIFKLSSIFNLYFIQSIIIVVFHFILAVIFHHNDAEDMSYFTIVDSHSPRNIFNSSSSDLSEIKFNIWSWYINLLQIPHHHQICFLKSSF
jgi:hypothetical protein